MGAARLNVGLRAHGAMTGDARFKALFQVQATQLLAELETTDNGPIWTQDLYGSVQRWPGPVHGFAGNMLPLLHGWDWLTSDQRAVVVDAVPRPLRRSPSAPT